MELVLTAEQDAELGTLINASDVSAAVANRARIVLWTAEGRMGRDIGPLAGLSLSAVDRWVDRYERYGMEATVAGPPQGSGLSHWSSRELAKHLKRAEKLSVSFHYITKVWRQEGLKPHQSGTFKLSKDPAFADEVADVVGLYLDPPGGAVVLSIDEKTQIQALDRTQPLLPLTFGATEKRTHDYVRHGTTNLFAAVNVGTGHVVGDCRPSRDGKEFLRFLKKATAAHLDKEVHVVLDNLSTHSTPQVRAWLAAHPNVTFHFTRRVRAGSTRWKPGSGS